MAPNNYNPLPKIPLEVNAADIELINPGQPFYRIHQSSYNTLYFATDDGYRFNAPDGEFGVCYMAAREQGAFVETCVRDLGNPNVSTKFLRDRCMTVLINLRPLRVLKLFGDSSVRLGATSQVSVGSYNVSQAWSLAIHNAANDIDGISYRSAIDNNEICYALFDRTQTDFTTKAKEALLDDQKLLAELLDHYNVALMT